MADKLRAVSGMRADGLNARGYAEDPQLENGWKPSAACVTKAAQPEACGPCRGLCVERLPVCRGLSSQGPVGRTLG
jgi:hypothetical protein